MTSSADAADLGGLSYEERRNLLFARDTPTEVLDRLEFTDEETWRFLDELAELWRKNGLPINGE
jgi:hypothetical protein